MGGGHLSTIWFFPGHDQICIYAFVGSNVVINSKRYAREEDKRGVGKKLKGSRRGKRRKRKKAPFEKCRSSERRGRELERHRSGMRRRRRRRVRMRMLEGKEGG